jgi:hypothetical protein
MGKVILKENQAESVAARFVHFLGDSIPDFSEKSGKWRIL